MAAGAVRGRNRRILLVLWFAVIGGISTSASEVCEDTDVGSDQSGYKLIGRLMLVKSDGDCTPVNVRAILSCGSGAEDGAESDEQEAPDDAHEVVDELCEDGEHLDEETGMVVPNCPKEGESGGLLDMDESFPVPQEVVKPAVVKARPGNDKDNTIIDDLIGTIIEMSSEQLDEDSQEEDKDDDDDLADADESEDSEKSEEDASKKPEEDKPDEIVIVSLEENSAELDVSFNNILGSGSLKNSKTIVDNDSSEPESSEHVDSDTEELPVTIEDISQGIVDNDSSEPESSEEVESDTEELPVTIEDIPKTIVDNDSSEPESSEQLESDTEKLPVTIEEIDVEEPVDTEFEGYLNEVLGQGSDTHENPVDEKVGSKENRPTSVEDMDESDEHTGSDKDSRAIADIIDGIIGYDLDLHEDHPDVSDGSNEDDEQDAQDIANIIADLLTMDSVEHEDSLESASEAPPTAAIPITTFNNSLDTKNMVCMDVNFVMQHIQQHHPVDFSHSMVVSPAVGPLGNYLATSVAHTVTWIENRMMHSPKLAEYTNRKSGLETLEHFLSHPKAVEQVLESNFGVLLKLLEDHMPQIVRFLDVVLEDVHENSQVLQFLLNGQGTAAYEYIKNAWHSKRR